MASFTQAARSIIQGVSEQDDKYMIDGQCRDLVNMVPSPIEGIVKRPSTMLVATYAFLDLNVDYKFFDVEVSGINYVFIVSVDNIYIVKDNLLSETLPIDGNNKNYIGDALDSIEIFYVNDSVYILNKDVIIRTIEEDAITHATTCAVWGVGISQNKNYTATVSVYKVADDTPVYSTTSTFLVSTAANTKTSVVISNLYANIVTTGEDTSLEPGDPGYGDPVVWFDKSTSKEVIVCKLKEELQSDYYIKVLTDDDASNTYLKSYSDTIKDSSLLPRLAVEGMRAIVSVAEGSVDDWYLNFVAKTESAPFVGETAVISVAYDNRDQSVYLDTDTETTFKLVMSGQRSVGTTIKAIQSSYYDFFLPNGDPMIVGSYVNVGDWEGTVITAKRRNSDTVPLEGIWKESAKPGSNNFLEATLPLVLTKELITYPDKPSDYEWQVQPAQWLPRSVGDEDSAPFPKFVDTTIKSLYEHAGRMVAVTDDGIELTTTNDVDNWFRNTATQLLTTDPFGLSSSQKKGRLTYPITLNGELFIWGDQDQFKLVGNNVGITTSSMIGVSSYTSSLTPPIVTGDVIHFISKTDKYNTLYAFSPSGNITNNYSAEAISDQIPTKIAGTIKHFVSSYNMNTLLITTEERPNVISLYNYYYNNSKLQQSAWSELEFDFDIEKIYVTDNKYTIITKYEGDYRVLSLDLRDLVRPEYVHVDFQQLINVKNGLGTPSLVQEEFVLIDYMNAKGKLLPYTIEQDGSIFCASLEDEEDYNCYFGRPFNTVYEPKLVVENSEQGNIKYTTDVKLNTLGLITGPSGSFDVNVKGLGFEHTTQYNSSAMTNNIYSFNTQEATFPVSIRARSEQSTSVRILSDSHLPLTLRGMYYRFRTSQRGILI